MQQIKIIQITTEQFRATISEILKTQLDELKKNFQPKEPTEYLTRREVSRLLKCDISTVHNLTTRSVLVKYGIGGRVYYKRKEVEEAIIKLNYK